MRLRAAVQPARLGQGVASRQAAPRIGITELRSAPREQSRLAVGNEQSELGLDGDEACGIRQNALPTNVRLLFTYSCFRRTSLVTAILLVLGGLVWLDPGCGCFGGYLEASSHLRLGVAGTLGAFSGLLLASRLQAG